MGKSSLPDYLVSEIGWSEHRVKQDLQIMTCYGIAVQVQRSGWLQHPVQFQQPNGHHREIGHHVVLAEKRAHRPQQVGGVGVAGAQHLIEGVLGLLPPMPGIFEGFDLRLRLRPRRRAEQHIVGRLRIERRVEVDQIDALAGDAVAQNVQVIAVIKRVRHWPPLPVCNPGELRTSIEQRQLIYRLLCRIARHTTSGVSGMSTWARPSASATALTIDGGAPQAPPSPMPLTPNSFDGLRTGLKSTSIDGKSDARGIA